MKRFVLFALVGIVVLSISSASIFVLLSNAPSYACAFWRLFLSTLFILSYYFLSGGSIDISKRVVGWTLLSGFMLGSHFLLWMESLFHVSVATSTTIVVSYPLFNLLLDIVLFRERVYWFQVLGLLTGFTGIILFMNPGITGESLYGSLLAFLGAVAATGYFSIGRYARNRLGIGLLEYALLTYGWASLVVLVYILVIGGNLYEYSPYTYVYFLLLALIPMLGGHTIMNYMLKYMKSSSVTAIALGEPVGASILAYFIFGQKLDVIKAVLMAVVLSSVVTVIMGEQDIQHSASSSRGGNLPQRSSSHLIK
ncbi:MAG: EamA family transporter [Thermoprotei archaeon]